MPHPPKLLSWMSRKARLHPRMTEALWQQAIIETAARYAEDHPDYWPTALRHLARLIEQESAVRQSNVSGLYAAPHLHDMIDYQSRMVVTAFHTWENVARVTSAGWQKLVNDWKTAA